MVFKKRVRASEPAKPIATPNATNSRPRAITSRSCHPYSNLLGALPNRARHDSVDAGHRKYHRDGTEDSKQGHGLAWLPELLRNIFI